MRENEVFLGAGPSRFLRRLLVNVDRTIELLREDERHYEQWKIDLLFDVLKVDVRDRSQNCAELTAYQFIFL